LEAQKLTYSSISHSLRPDTSRDQRIEDPTNLWIIHPMSRAALPVAIRLGISANAVSICGLLIGAGAAFAYRRWDDPTHAIVALILCMFWLVADGLDGMIARATGTASAIGRFLDGVCDHGVFILIYLTLAASVGTTQGWTLAILAGVAHAVQSSLFEAERARFHRRVRGAVLAPAPPRANRGVEFYDWVAGSLDRMAQPYDDAQARSGDAKAFGECYGEAAAPALRAMALLSANARIILIFLCCAFATPQHFWWIELVIMSGIAIFTMAWHRRIERRLIQDFLHGSHIE
jgi:CDP-diacylglycerol---serine O-phosphatidyltransferase